MTPQQSAPLPTPDESMAKLTALGYWTAEIEVSATHATVFVWRKYARADGFCKSGLTIAEAFAKVVKWAEEAVVHG